ncbi:MAG: YceI family protein [Segetibacter sp.]|nr:YceI family protein [Segetibacter sp.]
MKRIILLLLAAIAFTSVTHAQTYFTKNGMISFFSKSSLENISASNNQVVSVLNTKTGEIKFSVMINGFQFKKALMQEHFNENYMESEKYPKALFSGTIADISSVDLTKDGDYPVTANGDLTLHGVTKKITAPAVLTVKSGKLTGTTSFNVLVADYNIGIPKVVENNISKSIEIKVNCNYEPKS